MQARDVHGQTAAASANTNTEPVQMQTRAVHGQTAAASANTNTEPVLVQARDAHGQTAAASANTNTEPVSLCKLEMSMDRLQLPVLILTLSLCPCAS